MNLLRLHALAALAIASTACSSSSTTPPGSDAGGTSNLFKCGDGALTGTAQITDPVALKGAAQAVFAGAGCNTATSDDNGILQVAVPAGQAVAFTVTKAGYLKERGELTFLKSGFNARSVLYPESAKSTVALGWDAAKGYLAVALSAGGADGGACGVDGVVFSVKDHPEFTVGYLTDANVRSATLTATHKFGAIAIGPMPPGTYTVVGTKAGCTVAPLVDADYSFPATVTVVADTLTGYLMTVK